MARFFLIDQSCYRRRDEVSLVRCFFLSNDWTEAAGMEDADLVVFFSCAGLRFLVDEKLRAIRELGARLKPGAELVVGSCLPGVDGERLRSVFGGRTISPTDFSALNGLPGIRVRIETLPAIWGRNAACQPLATPPWRTALRIRLDEAALGTRRWLARHSPIALFPPEALRPRRRSTVTFSIAAGCSRRCAYCAKPFASGRVRSKPVEVVAGHIAEGIGRGYHRFDLFADSIGMYGADQGVTFGDLLRRLDAIRGRFSVGIFDLHPQDFLRDYAAIARLAARGRIHYLHVPVQSGNERVLALMNRPCRIGEVTDRLVEVRRCAPVFMQSGIVVGFPSETEEEFGDTLRLLQRVGFDDVYVHYYCDMPNTAASRMSGKVGPEAMRRRLEQVKASGIRHNLAATLHEWESNLAYHEQPGERVGGGGEGAPGVLPIV